MYPAVSPFSYGVFQLMSWEDVSRVVDSCNQVTLGDDGTADKIGLLNWPMFRLGKGVFCDVR